MTKYGAYALPRYAEVRAVIQDWQRFTSARGVGMDDAMNARSGRGILTTDPPLHDTRRKVLNAQLVPRALTTHEHSHHRQGRGDGRRPRRAWARSTPSPTSPSRTASAWSPIWSGCRRKDASTSSSGRPRRSTRSDPTTSCCAVRSWVSASCSTTARASRRRSGWCRNDGGARSTPPVSAATSSPRRARD